MNVSENCYVEFNSYLSVDLIKIQKNENKDNLTSYEDAILPEVREKTNTNTVLFTTFGSSATTSSNNDKTVQAFYFSLDGSLSNATISIFRKVPQQKYYDFVCTLDNKGFKLLDYNVLNNHYYHYMATALVDTGVPKIEPEDPPQIRYYIYENKDEQGNDIYIKSVFDSWSICDIEETTDENIYQCTGNTWKLGLNIEDESITQNVGISSWDTLGKYARQAYGQKNYASSQFTGFLGQIQEYDLYNIPEKSVYVDNPSELYSSQKVYGYTEKENLINSHALETEKLDSWLEFITNGKLKLLKDMKGNGWIVQVVDTNTYAINNQSNYKQTTISFSWKEALDIKQCSIIGMP